jgi:hypothetical protein
MSDADFEPAPVGPSAEELAMQEAQREADRSSRQERQRPSRTQAPDRSPPCSQEAEEHVVATVLLDGGETLQRCIDERISPEAFYFPANRLLYEICLDLHAAGKPVMLETLAEELKTRRQLEAVGGFAYLMQVTGKIPTTAHAGYFIEKVREKHLLREAIKTATGIVERAYSFTGGLDEFLSEAQFRLGALTPSTKAPVSVRTPFSFQIPPKDDRSILLGNRYLNRGDGLVLSSSSGMGKSSMSHQMASNWALGESFHGIPANGEMRILIVQSEDSDGDIAECWQSIKHVRKFSPEQIATLEKNIRIISERSLRGVAFIRWLDKQAKDFKPDLVLINPLQAFIDGDVTDSHDLGAFLREGLNGINKAAEFGYVIVHHTTKPATGKDRGERQWHEVMYDMAGGAEIINWARGIISLRACEEVGKFRVVLAKRGRRAGVTREVQQGAGTRLEIVTQFGLQHASGFLPGTDTGIIFWEACALPSEDAPSGKSKSPGRPEKYQFSDYRSIFPTKESKGLNLNELHRALVPNGEIQKKNLHQVCKRWAEDGDVEIIDEHGQPRRYRAAL